MPEFEFGVPAMQEPYSARLEKLKGTIADNNLKGVIMVPGANLRFYTGVNSLLMERPFLFMVPLEGDPHLVVPTLESGPYGRAPVKIMLHKWSDTEGPSSTLQEAINQLQLNGRWGVEGDVPYRFVHLLLRYAQPQLENADPMLQSIRAVKDAEEIRRLGRAASILSKSFLHFFHLMKPGLSEIEVALKVGQEIARNGAESVQDVLVQSGPMAADGHHVPLSRKLRRKESVVVDATCTFGGYFADITRTFMIGRDPEFEELYNNVLEAQVAAVKASRAGVSVGSIDQAARGYLRNHQLDDYFIHRTGHGLGLEVHEAPYIIPNGAEITQESMAFTIEPGVYMQGKTGVRIEDDLITTTAGNKNLTKAVPKEFGWWN
jgi:Xaa-Pro dipeptidase